MTIRFVVYGRLDQVSGGYRYDREVVRFLRQRGDEVDVVGIRRLPHLLSSLQSFTPATRSLIRPSGSKRCDAIVIDELVHPSVHRVVARRSADCPPVFVLVHHLASRERLRPVARARARSMERRLLEAADRVIVTSGVTGATVRELVRRPCPIRVCVPGSDMPGEGTARAEVSAGERRGGRPRILVTGNLIARKGHDLLLEALSGLRELSWELRVVGAPVDRRYVRRLSSMVAQLGFDDRVTFAGFVPDAAMSLEYRRAEVFAFPSRYEGYGISLAEALRAGLPFVAFASGGIAEVARGSDSLVADGDIEGFRSRLRRLLADPVHRAVESARSRELAARLPSWEDTARCFARAIDEGVRHG